MLYVSYVIAAVVAYLIGSIPTGYLIVKVKTGQDIREVGSGSIGATNVKRVLGKKWFFIVMFLDALKGAVPVVLARIFAIDISGLTVMIAAIAVILGHSKSIFLNFKGGKSVASGVGTIMAMSPIVGLILAAIWGVLTYATRYVSVGSIIALVISPTLMYVFGKPFYYVVYCSIAAIYIMWLHRENIVRLSKGEENKVR